MSIAPIVTCRDTEFPGPDLRQVVVDREQKTISFHNCHWQQTFFTHKWDDAARFPISDLHSVREAQSSLWIKTPAGVVRVFSKWQNYTALRELLFKLAPKSKAPWYTHPKLIPVYATIAVLILTLLLFKFA